MPTETGHPPARTGRPLAEEDVVAELTTVLVKTLRALGQAGQPDRALPLAASAWSVLRRRDAEQAERVNGTMHYLARRPDSAPVAGHAPGGQDEVPATRASRPGPAA